MKEVSYKAPPPSPAIPGGSIASFRFSTRACCRGALGPRTKGGLCQMIKTPGPSPYTHTRHGVHYFTCSDTRPRSYVHKSWCVLLQTQRDQATRIHVHYTVRAASGRTGHPPPCTLHGVDCFKDRDSRPPSSMYMVCTTSKTGVPGHADASMSITYGGEPAVAGSCTPCAHVRRWGGSFLSALLLLGLGLIVRWGCVLWSPAPAW